MSINKQVSLEMDELILEMHETQVAFGAAKHDSMNTILDIRSVGDVSWPNEGQRVLEKTRAVKENRNQQRSLYKALSGNLAKEAALVSQLSGMQEQADSIRSSMLEQKCNHGGNCNLL